MNAVTTGTAATPRHRPAGSRRRAGGAVRLVIGIALLAVLLFPVYWMVNASFQDSSALLSADPDWFPVHGTLDGYRKALATQGPNLLTSAVIATGAVVVSLGLAIPAAYAVVRFRLPGSMVLIFLLMVIQMIPAIVIGNALFDIFSRLGFVDNIAALILADASHSVPFAIIILRAFMLSIPSEMIEAAQIDGAGHWRTLVSIVLPVSRNSVITAGLFAFLFAWADFVFGVTLTTGQTFKPITVGIYQFIGAQSSDWNAILATSVLASIPATVLLVLAQRYIAAGVTGGAVKE